MCPIPSLSMKYLTALPHVYDPIPSLQSATITSLIFNLVTKKFIVALFSNRYSNTYLVFIVVKEPF